MKRSKPLNTEVKQGFTKETRRKAKKPLFFVLVFPLCLCVSVLRGLFFSSQCQSLVSSTPNLNIALLSAVLGIEMSGGVMRYFEFRRPTMRQSALQKST